MGGINIKYNRLFIFLDPRDCPVETGIDAGVFVLITCC